MDARTPEILRKEIRATLPADTFERQPQRAWWFVPLVATSVAGIATIITVRPAWYVCLLIGLGVGQCMAASGFLAHEVLHGSVVGSTRLQTALGYLGFGPMLVSPTLWRTWHNQVHHGKTNHGNSDPDGFGTVGRYEKAPSTRFVARLAPGSRHPLSYLFLGYWFTFHGQVVLWIQSRYMRSFARLNRRRAITDSAACAVIWLVVAILAGPFYALFAVVVPIVVTNAIVMGYIATNHFMRPLTESNDPIENSMSVTTLPVVDRLHFNFSHHVEHHLFPTMSAKHAPRVRAWLLAHEADRYVAPAHWTAIAYLYRTPRVYLDATTLVDPDHPNGPYRADTRELADALR
ncbi:MAG: fatty acid desaturase family protein [Actinomycetes bacterium]